jgi:ABC-type uncharacterized transport system ATPase subunit
LLEVKGLRVAYGGIQAVKGIDLTVAQGELVTFIGANGAGKSTTLKALAGLLRPASGSIHYNGMDITARPAFELVRQARAVPEGRGVSGGSRSRRIWRWALTAAATRMPRRDGRAMPRLAGGASGSCRAASSRCSRSGVR